MVTIERACASSSSFTPVPVVIPAVETGGGTVQIGAVRQRFLSLVALPRTSSASEEPTVREATSSTNAVWARSTLSPLRPSA